MQVCSDIFALDSIQNLTTLSFILLSVCLSWERDLLAVLPKVSKTRDLGAKFLNFSTAIVNATELLCRETPACSTLGVYSSLLREGSTFVRNISFLSSWSVTDDIVCIGNEMFGI